MTTAAVFGPTPGKVISHSLTSLNGISFNIDKSYPPVLRYISLSIFFILIDFCLPRPPILIILSNCSSVDSTISSQLIYLDFKFLKAFSAFISDVF